MTDTNVADGLIKFFLKKMLEATDYGVYNAAAIFYTFHNAAWWDIAYVTH
ncbi:inosine-5-monophosphate dehydrogenase [Providencia rustigianii]|uniref:Uncharacterized protein n=1 Tax=Providencia rustigianii DSM 4541 TaxID=500637 RepID=D1P4Z4_9GAMM|nr:hypothetical protein PROVRUST_07298 [Providencia rustigianii DSM 4541]MTC57648.1 inosine-5-monophosphate dehydrogenase [Providencia rustigianii]MTC59161.1 inosine-5-monophosphate dehydrogenase [Providencia rustigianii]